MLNTAQALHLVEGPNKSGLEEIDEISTILIRQLKAIDTLQAQKDAADNDKEETVKGMLEASHRVIVQNQGTDDNESSRKKRKASAEMSTPGSFSSSNGASPFDTTDSFLNLGKSFMEQFKPKEESVTFPAHMAELSLDAFLEKIKLVDSDAKAEILVSNFDPAIYIGLYNETGEKMTSFKSEVVQLGVGVGTSFKLFIAMRSFAKL